METLLQRFENLKNLLSQRASAALGESLLTAFLRSLDEYQDAIVKNMTTAGKELASLQSENDVLRSLVGRPLPDALAAVLAKNEEVRFLKEQLEALKKELAQSRDATDAQRLESETRAADLERSRNEREQEQNKFKEELAALHQQLKTIGQKVFEKQQAMKQETADITTRFEDRERELYARTDDEIRSVAAKLGTLCQQAAGATENCREALESAAQQPPVPAPAAAPAKRRTWFGRKSEPETVPVPAPESRSIARAAAQLGGALEATREAGRVIELYLKILDRNEPEYARVVWPRFWSELKRRVTGESPLRQNVKIAWPGEKNLPPFVTDEAMLLDIGEALLRNGLEALTAEGSVEIGVEITPTRLVLQFTDTGQGIKPQDMERVFVPFFSTKTGHAGLGLTQARKLVRLLGGRVTCEPRGVGARFTVTVAGQPLPAAKAPAGK
jgi:signal transduction histidine kinase